VHTPPSLNNSMQKRPRFTILIFLVILVPLAVIFCTGIGAVMVNPLSIIRVLLAKLGIVLGGEAYKKVEALIVMVRLPRVITALLVGSALATAGATMQGLFRNPLASPEILGVSAGGSLGAVIAISTGFFALNIYLMPIASITGALIAAIIIYVISTSRGNTSLLFIILAGMAVSSFFNGMISAVLLFAEEYQMSQFIFWTMGALDKRRWEHIFLVLPFLIPGIIILILFSRELNLFSLGEEQAHALGMRVELVKRLLLGLSAVITGVAVSISGTIGFIGLMVPHLLRLLMGPDNRQLIPACALGGGLFLMVCDMIGRTVFAPFEIRVGIITAAVGAPYLLFLIFLYQRKAYGGNKRKQDA
jgi:iron complex transport system permease protein